MADSNTQDEKARISSKDQNVIQRARRITFGNGPTSIALLSAPFFHCVSRMTQHRLSPFSGDERLEED